MGRRGEGGIEPQPYERPELHLRQSAYTIASCAINGAHFTSSKSDRPWLERDGPDLKSSAAATRGVALCVCVPPSLWRVRVELTQQSQLPSCKCYPENLRIAAGDCTPGNGA